MLRIAPRMMVVLLCGTMLAGCATTKTPDVAKLTGGDTQAGHGQKEMAALDKTAPTDLEGGIRQAQLMRLSGKYDDAIHNLSQLMLVASDDPRVVAEYGKALAQKGRAQDAVEFLNRAIELSSNDWTLYSALGVSYDQLGNQVSARAAYEHALALRPEEASILNNYALSRMLAGDKDGARILIGRAQAAGGASDSKIASNIAMLNKIDATPAAPQNVALAQTAASARPAAPMAANVAPPMPHPMPQQMAAPVAQNMPRAIVPAPVQQQTLARNNAVVMQAVPFDPLAGPVKPARAPRVAAAEKVELPKSDIIKPAAIPAAPVAKPAVPALVKTADAKPAETKTAAKADAGKAVKAIAVKDSGKATDKDAIPALRMSANAY